MKRELNRVVAGAVIALAGFGSSLRAETISTFDVVLATGSVRLSTTTTTAGMIYSGADVWMHARGAQNSFFGIESGNLFVSSGANTAVGNPSLSALTGGDHNTAVGSPALEYLMTGRNNVAVGSFAMDLGGSNNNTALGYAALHNLSTGTDNVGVGISSLYENLSGVGHIAIGAGAAPDLATGFGAIAIGVASMWSYPGGTNNIAIGSLSGSNYGAGGDNLTGSHNVFLGYQTGVLENVSNSVAIGRNSAVAKDFVIALGGIGQYAAQVGIGTSSPTASLDVVGDAQFGSGASKSTFTAAGLLKLTPNGIQWADGTTSTTAATATAGVRSVSSTTFNTANFTSGTHGTNTVCVSGATVTYVSCGYPAIITYSSYLIAPAGNNFSFTGVLKNGGYFKGQSSSVGVQRGSINSQEESSWTLIDVDTTAGTRSYCLTAWASAPATVTLSAPINFSVVEPGCSQ